MNVNELNRHDRSLRTAIRNAYVIATPGEIQQQINYRSAINGSRSFDVACLRELLEEIQAEPAK